MHSSRVKGLGERVCGKALNDGNHFMRTTVSSPGKNQPVVVTRKQFIQGNAQGIEVGTEIYRSVHAAGLFERHVREISVEVVRRLVRPQVCVLQLIGRNFL